MSDLSHPAPPFDPELAAALAAAGDLIPSTITPEMIPIFRANPMSVPIEDLLVDRSVVFTETLVPGFNGDPEVLVTIFSRSDHIPGGPGIFYIHGGGMVIGDRFVGIGNVLDLVEHFDAIAITVEYRLAPENPDPAPIHDCYAGLTWMAHNASELGFDPDRLLVAGGSAGGGLAAGVALMARDRSGPKLCGQLLLYPMLDDRNETISSHQIDGIGIWDRGSNDTGWNALLGDRRGSDEVSIYAAPGRASDLGNLPATYIEVGSAEVFRDEDVNYAMRIWANGGVAELHVWPGGFHACDGFAPDSRIAKLMIQSRLRWLENLFQG